MGVFTETCTTFNLLKDSVRKLPRKKRSGPKLGVLMNGTPKGSLLFNQLFNYASLNNSFSIRDCLIASSLVPWTSSSTD